MANLKRDRITCFKSFISDQTYRRFSFARENENLAEKFSKTVNLVKKSLTYQDEKQQIIQKHELRLSQAKKSFD